MSFSLESLLNRLTDSYNKATDSNIAKLFQVLLSEINSLTVNNEDIENASLIDSATGYSLDRIGDNVNQARGSLSDEEYRAAIKTKIRSNLSAGDINSIIEYIATILQLDVSDIRIRDTNQGNFYFSDGVIEENQEYGYSGVFYNYDTTQLIDTATTIDNTKTFTSTRTFNDLFSYLFNLLYTTDFKDVGGQFFEPASYAINMPLEQVIQTEQEVLNILEQISASGVKVYYEGGI